MKKYLYQGWAGNTYSHKCTGNSKMIYYEFTDKITNKEINALDAQLPLFANIKAIKDGLEVYIPSVAVMADNVSCKQAAYFPIAISNKTYNTFEETYADQSNPSDILITDVIKRRITAEEYWSLSNPTFTIGVYKHGIVDNSGVATVEAMLDFIINTYEFEPEMTFNDWINSKYNVDNISINTISESGRIACYYPKYKYLHSWYDNGHIEFTYNGGTPIKKDTLMIDVVQGEKYTDDYNKSVNVMLNNSWDVTE